MNDKGNKGIEMQVKIGDGVNVNIKPDVLFTEAKDGATDALNKVGKKLPNIPKLNMSDSDSSFEKRTEERKRD